MPMLPFFFLNYHYSRFPFYRFIYRKRKKKKKKKNRFDRKNGMQFLEITRKEDFCDL